MESLVVVLCGKKRLHTFYLKIQLDGSPHAFLQFSQGNGNILLCIQGGADGCEQMRVVRCDNMFIIQLQGSDKSSLQLRKEVKRPAKEGNMSADRFTAGKTGDGLVDNCLENGSGKIFLGCSVVDQRLDICLCENTAPGLNEYAKHYKALYPIAARCGVFAKTDIQPLINDGATKEDLSASIFQAVVNQTISGLACGKPIRGHVAFLGGPLHFLSELKTAFVRTLKLDDEHTIVPDNSHLFAAIGSAMNADGKTEIAVSLVGGKIGGHDVVDTLARQKFVILGLIFKQRLKTGNLKIDSNFPFSH